MHGRMQEMEGIDYGKTDRKPNAVGLGHLGAVCDVRLRGAKCPELRR